MTFKKRLIISNLVMIALPLLFSAVLLWGIGVLSGGLLTLPDKLKTLGVLGILLLVLLLLVSAVAMTITVMTKLLRSIANVKLAVTRIKEGDLSGSTVSSTGDEFSEVFSALNEMSSRLQQSLREQGQAEEYKTQMIANISHDLKTPITAIRGYAQGLLDGVANTPERTDRYLQTICGKADDLNRLVDDLLAFSKLTAEPVPQDLTPTDLVFFLQETAACEGIEVIHDYDAGNSLTVNLNTREFSRVIQNILENSRKYAKVPHCVVTINFHRRDDAVVLAFTDNGQGVPPDQLEYIFQRFYRGDGARTDPGSGSGLGLNIAQQIVTAHKGKIWARCPQSGGLCIHISLPL